MWVKGLDALCIALLATSAQALYEDQAGQYDWYKPMIGHATTGCYSTSAQYMILGTDSNVLSAMSADGEIVWRHVMPVEQEMDLIVCDNVRVATVSANGSYIRMWSAKTGELIWERYSGAKKDEGQVSAAFTQDGNLHVLVKDSLTQYNGFGDVVDTITPPQDTQEIFSNAKGDGINLFTLQGSSDVHVYSVNGAGTARDAVVKLSTQAHTYEHVVVNGGNTFVTLCGGAAVCAGEIASGKVTTVEVFNEKDKAGNYTSISLAGSDLLLLNTETTSAVFRLTSTSKAQIVKKFDTTDVYCDGNVCATLTSGKVVESLVFAEESGSAAPQAASVILPETSVYGEIDRVFAHNQDTLVVVLSDSATIFIAHGALKAVREEALAQTVQALVLALPADRDQIELLTEEFNVESSRNFLVAISTRLVTQAKQFRRFVTWAIKSPSEFFAWMGFTNSASSKETMTTDAFGMHKVIVCMCANGKIVGLHSNSGRVVYGVGLDSEEFAPREETPLIVSRSAAHFPHEPTVYAFGTSQQSGEFVAWTFNPITGKAEQAQGLPSNIVLISSLGHHDHSFARPILLLSDDDSVHVLPATADAHSTVQQMIPNLFLHSVDMNNGLAQGYEVISKDSKLYGRQSWSVGINTETDTIVAVSRKPQYEKNPLQFQMIGDAQEKLLYKYLNKNQMAMATLSNTGLLTILLLDTVTGNVIQRLTHRDAAEPVHVVQWVNNVVYTYQNIQEQRTEVVSMSLFESSNPDSRQEFESSKSTQPIAIRQAMVLGATVDTLAVAQTAQGLASNTILFGLRTGGLLSLSEKLLDPRRPVGKDAKPVLGLTPYTPLIPMLPINLLNYYHRIHRFTAVRSASTLLESRAVVFAHGLDMFSCSITPAGSFDQLGEEFNRPFLLACLIGITVAAGITEYFAREKKLKQKWK